MKCSFYHTVLRSYMYMNMEAIRFILLCSGALVLFLMDTTQTQLTTQSQCESIYIHAHPTYCLQGIVTQKFNKKKWEVGSH